MNSSIIDHSLLLPNLKILRWEQKSGNMYFEVQTARRPMGCQVCATKCTTVYDRRKIQIKDERIRNFHVVLRIWKKRYWCEQCKKPRTEPVDGVLPRRRTTQRYRAWIKTLCSQFSNLEDVRKQAKCSRDFVYRAYYEQLELETRKRRNPWPRAIGIDEHAFRRSKKYGGTEFAVMVVNHNRRRVIEVVEGKTTAALENSLAYIPGRENTEVVTLDMCDPFRKFARTFFPQADIVADKFHVLRLLNTPLNKMRKEITGDRRTLTIRTDLLRNRKNMDYSRRREVDRFLSYHPKLEELYYWKEQLHTLYRTRGYERASEAYLFMLDEMARSKAPEIITLRKTLLKWKVEILNYFKKRYTNGRVEGFNNVAKTIKKRAYGFKSFENYRLRVLNACF